MKDFEFPYAKDKVEDKSSATLFFAYISFWLTLFMVIISAFQESVLTALISSFVLFLICIFFYRARKIDTLKLSRDGFEIGDDDDNDSNSDTDTRGGSQAINEEGKTGWGNANK